MGARSKPYAVGVKDLKFVDSYRVLVGEEGPLDSAKVSTTLSESADLPTITNMDVISDDPTSVSDSLDVDTGSISSWKTNITDNFAGINEAINSSVSKGEGALKNSLDTITLSVTSAFKGANEAVDSAVNKVLSAVDQAGELAGNRLTGISNDSREASNRVGILAVDVLRGTIVAAEDSLLRGATFVVYAYGSVKKLLPSEFQSVLNISEERAVNILRPVLAAFQQVYISLEGLERSLGLEPSDPIVPFVLFLGTSGLFWASYWVLTYNGYAGNLPPKVSLEFLTGKENAVLIDVRPEARDCKIFLTFSFLRLVFRESLNCIHVIGRPMEFRERDGIPDLRRAARSRYASVSLPEVDGSVRKLLKSGKGLDETLIAAVIRNLKVVQDRSEVIVMDADGTRSKGIARSLRKLGRPYLVQGGYRSWVKEGLRVKELRTETTLTILNEDVEAILEEVKPTPLKVLGYGVGLIAAAYALSVKESSLARMISSLKGGSADTKEVIPRKWEKTLQLVGVLGLGLLFLSLEIPPPLFPFLFPSSIKIGNEPLSNSYLNLRPVLLSEVQTIYLRVASYKDSEDLKQDVRTFTMRVKVSEMVSQHTWLSWYPIVVCYGLLLVPAKLGGQAISWAAGKLETNRIGLPTSPSSSDVQSRVLQAAAKHESQPSDSEETPDRPPEPTAPRSENIDLSEA
ncbi:hypothetical protein RJ639_016993 [Escallonia herrerae]|uniref:Rhodanese domain-containing protein n=1 Tax=Escallonia herrerae TaxID=1293975 RepID=A0AA88VD74_9ASTE|nr:hypothetical protein RJ639_016993 [Escallonia herrerae]